MQQMPLCRLLGVRYPILQGALGPHDTSDLAIAVSRAGGFGVLSTSEAEDPYSDTRRQIQKLAWEGKPFGINIPVNSYSSKTRLRAIFDELENESVRRTLKAVITSAGSPTWCAADLQKRSVAHFQVVASVKHAKKAEDAGCSGVIAEGYESGGHVSAGAGVTTMVLVPAVIEAVRLPVVAAGGLIDGKGLVAALALGASGIQMGTRLYMTSEAKFADPKLQGALLHADVSDTTIVPGTYGENRHWSNQFTTELLALVRAGASREEIEVVKKKGRQEKHGGNPLLASVPIGMAIGRISDVKSVEQVFARIIEEAGQSIRELSAVI